MTDFIASEITKDFETPRDKLRILDGVTIHMNRGENLAIVGPSGCGKSTLLHIVGTLEPPTSGSVSLDGIDICQLAPKKLASFRNQKIGFIFQEHHLLPQLTAIENVLIPVLADRKPDSDTFQQARQLLDRVGLADRADHRPATLSGGERQRVAVARALMMKPTLILADEPTGSLDPVNAETIGNLLLELQQQENALLICVTHSSKLAGQFQKQLRLEQGKLVD